MIRPAPTAIGLGTALAISSAMGYALNAVTAQIAAGVGVSGALLVFWRVFLMLGAVGLVAFILKPSFAVPPKERGPLLLFGLTSTVVGIAYLTSIAHLPVSVAAVAFYTFPILILLAEPIVDGRRLTPARLGIALMAIVGVALAVGPQLSGLSLLGLGLAGLAAAGAATQFFAATRLRATSASAKLFWGHLLVLPGAALTLWWTGGFRPLSVIADAPWAISVTLLCYLGAMALQLMALGRVPASVAGLAFCAEPVLSALLAYLLLGERLAPMQYVGGALVVLAIALNTLAARRA